MPNTLSRWWPKFWTLSVSRPASTSVRWPMPKRISVRKAAESNFCAVVVASIACGGSRQLSQLPQRSGGCSPKWRAGWRGGSRRSRPGGERVEPLALGRLAGSSTSVSIRRRAGEIVGAPEQPGLGGLAVAAGAAGLLVKASIDLGMPAWATKRTSGLSMPMPKAIVATIAMSSEDDERRLVARAHARARGRHDRAEPAGRSRRAARPASRPCRGSGT